MRKKQFSELKIWIDHRPNPNWISVQDLGTLKNLLLSLDGGFFGHVHVSYGREIPPRFRDVDLLSWLKAVLEPTTAKERRFTFDLWITHHDWNTTCVAQEVRQLHSAVKASIQKHNAIDPNLSLLSSDW